MYGSVFRRENRKHFHTSAACEEDLSVSVRLKEMPKWPQLSLTSLCAFRAKSRALNLSKASLNHLKIGSRSRLVGIPRSPFVLVWVELGGICMKPMGRHGCVLCLANGANPGQLSWLKFRCTFTQFLPVLGRWLLNNVLTNRKNTNKYILCKTIKIMPSSKVYCKWEKHINR